MDSIYSLYFAAIGQTLGWTVFHSLWQIAAIAILLRLGLRLLPQSRPNQRYIMLLIGLVAALGIAMLTASVQWNKNKPLLPTPTEAVGVDIPDQQIVLFQMVDKVSQEGLLGLSLHELKLQLDPYMPFISMLWLAGVIIFLGMMVSGFFYLDFLKREGVTRLSEEWMQKFQELKARMNVNQSILLLGSTQIESPVAFRLFKPVILIPLALLSNLNPIQVEVLILHELAHIRRYDFGINLIQSLIEIVFFYHPAMWWIASSIRAEREHCCDALVVNAINDKVLYAQTLTQIQAFQFSQKTKLIMAANPNSSLLSKRIFRLFGKYDQQPSLVKSLLLTVLLLLSVTLPALYAQAFSHLEKVELNAVVDEGTDQFTNTDLSNTEKIILEGRIEENNKETIFLKTILKLGNNDLLDIEQLEDIPFQEVDTYSADEIPDLFREDMNMEALGEILMQKEIPIFPFPAKKKDQLMKIRGANDTIPLFIVDGIMIDRSKGDDPLKTINPEEIDHINVLKGESATKMYGEDGRHGVVEIITKKAAAKGSPIYIVDGKELKVKAGFNPLDTILPEKIANVDVIKGKKAIVIYGDRASNGVVVITTKENVDKEPLLVLDGKVLGRKNNVLENIEPNQIKSITILKDSSAMALYGVEGKDGVVIIESKSKNLDISKSKDNKDGEKTIVKIRSVGKVSDAAEVKVVKPVIPEVDEIELVLPAVEEVGKIDHIEVVKVEKSEPGKAILEGEILSDNGTPLIGTSIIIKGTNVGTISDIKGKFRLSVPDSCVDVMFTYVGFEMLTIKEVCGVSSNVKIVLNELKGNKATKEEKPAKMKAEPAKPGQIKTDKSSLPKLETKETFSLNTYPNPFEEIITIEFIPGESNKVDLNVFNVNGQLVEQIYSGDTMSYGLQQFSWAPTDLEKGTYLVTLTVDGKTVSKKVVLK